MNKSAYNQINPAKLRLSKWTAVSPRNKEKHFLVTELNENELGVVVTCNLEAVLTKQQYEVAWRALKDRANWRPGWH